MNYRIKQKLFPLRDDFFIQDGAGRDAFRIEDQTSGLLYHLSFQDLSGKEIASIDQQYLIGSTYEIHKAGQRWAVVGKDFALLHQKFTVRVAGQDDIRAKGNFGDSEYDFTRGERVIAHVKKQSGLVLDSYTIWVGPQQDDVLILATAVVIGLCQKRESWVVD
jgi:uncharacterized protein YxjI